MGIATVALNSVTAGLITFNYFVTRRIYRVTEQRIDYLHARIEVLERYNHMHVSFTQQDIVQT